MDLLESHQFSTPAGETISYLAAGPRTGRFLVFCHGWPAIGKTWEPQLVFFAALGYRVIAPDMPGYGGSGSSIRVKERYALENVNKTMISLLGECGQDEAVWIGHDWGAVAVWSFAAHYPSKVTAVVGLARPYHTLEYGLDEVIFTVNRDVYPVESYPYGQYDYQVYFTRAFDAATAWFDADPSAVLRAVYARGNPHEVGKPALTATTVRDGGWLGGAPAPPTSLKGTPSQALCVSEELLAEVEHALKTGGFWAPNAWYSNHEVNREYSLAAENGGYLDMPVLFIGATLDPISDITVSSIARAQKKYCRNLKEVHIEAGHWVALEKADEVNAAIKQWLVEIGL